MYIERLQEEISGLIEKIKLDWGRIKSQSPGIHKIDKDIITSDIRRLYDLIYEVDLGKPEPKKSKLSYLESIVPSGISNTQPSSGIAKNLEPKPEPELLPELLPVTASNPAFEVLSKNIQTDDIEAILTHKVLGSEIIDKPVETKKFQQNENSLPDFGRVAEKPEPARQKQVQKSTIDLFTAPKTIADTFQNSSDNSYAARMQKNPIDDIKSAIGINEKFLFINTIFDGEISLYNKVIDRLNELPDFYLALHFMDELKANYEKDTNRDAFAKLLEIVKRKYL